MTEPAYVGRLEKQIEQATTRSLEALERTAGTVDRLASQVGELARIVEVSVAQKNGNGSAMTRAYEAARDATPMTKSASIVLGVITVVGTLVYLPLKGQVDDVPRQIREATRSLEINTNANTGAIGNIYTVLAKVNTHQDEVEGQIRNLGSFLNEFEQGDEQKQALLWKVVFKEELPRRDYWPEFGRIAADGRQAQ